MGDGREAVDHGLPALGGVGHGGGEKRPGEVVVPFRDGRSEVDLAGSVELRRPPGPGARPPGEALEADLDDPRLHELVEVEGRHGPTHTERGRRLVSRRPAVGRRQHAVQVAPQRLVQHGDRGDPSLEIGGASTPPL